MSHHIVFDVLMAIMWTTALCVGWRVHKDTASRPMIVGGITVVVSMMVAIVLINHF